MLERAGPGLEVLLRHQHLGDLYVFHVHYRQRQLDLDPAALLAFDGLLPDGTHGSIAAAGNLQTLSAETHLHDIAGELAVGGQAIEETVRGGAAAKTERQSQCEKQPAHDVLL